MRAPTASPAQCIRPKFPASPAARSAKEKKKKEKDALPGFFLQQLGSSYPIEAASFQ
jgi:hypothetical protein